jgi:hypothetical protein
MDTEELTHRTDVRESKMLGVHIWDIPADKVILFVQVSSSRLTPRSSLLPKPNGSL